MWCPCAAGQSESVAWPGPCGRAGWLAEPVHSCLTPYSLYALCVRISTMQATKKGANGNQRTMEEAVYRCGPVFRSDRVNRNGWDTKIARPRPGTVLGLGRSRFKWMSTSGHAESRRHSSHGICKPGRWVWREAWSRGAPRDACTALRRRRSESFPLRVIPAPSHSRSESFPLRVIPAPCHFRKCSESFVLRVIGASDFGPLELPLVTGSSSHRPLCYRCNLHLLKVWCNRCKP